MFDFARLKMLFALIPHHHTHVFPAAKLVLQLVRHHSKQGLEALLSAGLLSSLCGSIAQMRNRDVSTLVVLLDILKVLLEKEHQKHKAVSVGAVQLILSL